MGLSEKNVRDLAHEETGNADGHNGSGKEDRGEGGEQSHSTLSSRRRQLVNLSVKLQLC